MVLAVAVLFAALRSIVVELTVARLVIVPQMAGVTMMVIGGAPPGATLPPLQVTTPPACTQVQPVPEALWKVTPGGRLSVTCTLAAVDGPPLVTVTVEVSVAPAFAGSGLSVLVIDRAACAMTALVSFGSLHAVVKPLLFTSPE